MTENESKYGKIAIVGGGRCSGKTAVIQLEIFEELQAYRAIGTVEEIKALSSMEIHNFNALQKYRAIGTIEEFKDLKEKESKKLEEDEYGFSDYWEEN